MKKLSAKRLEILNFIMDFSASQGYPPSVREICRAVNLKSPSTVHMHIKILQDGGYIEKDDNKTRALIIKGDGRHIKRIPILGRVTAGLPALAYEDIEGYVPFDGTEEDCFALRVSGDSMKNAGILDGDKIVVRKTTVASHGEIVVALIEDEATVKRLYLKNNLLRLMPENEDYEPIDAPNAQILGVVRAVYRKY